MRASISSSRLAGLVLAGVLLAPGAARAQVPPAAPAPVPPPGYAAPGGYAPPPGYAAPGGYAPPPGYAPYAPYPQQQGYYGQGYAPAPYVPTRRRSSAMMAAGITMLALGGTGMIIGASMFSAGNTPIYINYPACFAGSDCSATPPNNSSLKSAGIATMVISVASMGAGLPLTLVGMQKVRDTPAAALVPDVRLGAGSGAMTWRS